MGKRVKTRIRRKNGGFKKIILILILLFIIIQLFIRIIVPGVVTFSRFVYKKGKNFYFNSKSFYFNSDKLSEDDSARFESDNWSGADTYSVTVNMNSRKNINEVCKENINYNIKADCKVFDKNDNEQKGDLVDFVIAETLMKDYDSNQGIDRTIFTDTNKSSFDFSISLKPNVTLQNGDYVFVTITTTSTSPYEKTLRGTFKIIIGKPGMSYQIEDQAFSPYLNVIVTNTRNYYTVDTAFGGHKVGSTLEISEYLALSDADKEKCHSMFIELEFDPTEIILDTTSSAYLEAKEKSLVRYKTISETNAETNETKEYEYANYIKFKIDAEESKVIKFYKKVASNDYTYPNTNGATPKISVLSN